MLLYDLRSGMHPRRVRILLAEKNVQIPVKSVDVMAKENDGATFRGINSLGKLPVLELDDGTIISESMAICRYLESVYPTPPLFGSTDLEEAKIDMWSRRAEYEIARPILDAFLHGSDFYKDRIQQVSAYADWSKRRAADGMAWLDAELANTRHIGQEEYSMADIVAQCAFILGRAMGIRIPEGLANLTQWFSNVSSRPSARA